MTTASLQKTYMPSVCLLKRGKVRDLYDLGNSLLVVATDRVSAFDVVMPTPIPGRGKILTQISVFWFNSLRDIIPNHLLTVDCDQFPDPLREYREQLQGRSMVVRKARRIDVECVARGYLCGSGWREYRDSGSVGGVALPSGLSQNQRLPKPIFTPSTKVEDGHDENITFGQLVEIIGEDLAERLSSLTLDLYEQASRFLIDRGVAIADTKFEFGWCEGELLLIDEALTPDSSRFWLTDEGRMPAVGGISYDKELLRDYLRKIGWEGSTPPPALPEELTSMMVDRYQELATRILGGPVL